MKNHLSQNRKWLFVSFGIVIGLVVALGLNATGNSVAGANDPAPNPSTVEQQIPSPSTDIVVAKQISNAFATVAEKVNPSVVTVFTETEIQTRQPANFGSPFRDFFGEEFFRHFQQPGPKVNPKQHGLGSGIVVTEDGTILTNNHVIDKADNIMVRFGDGREFEATIKGKDEKTDLAILAIEADNLTPIKFGNSEKVRVGEWVLAVGSPLNPQLESTFTSGIVSAKGRTGVGLTHYEDFIQTDAAINPGNSGGALVNLDGELIGINSAIATRNGGFMGIGFAIPVNLAEKIMTDIIVDGKVTRGWLGVYIQNISPEIAKALELEAARGVIVAKVEEDSPAENAGIKEEDVVLEINGQKVDNSTALSTKVAATSPGDVVNLTIIRDGSKKDFEVVIGELEARTQLLGQGKGENSELGLELAEVNPELIERYNLNGINEGVVVTGIKPNSVADQAGFRPGDILLKLNRTRIKDVEDVNEVMEEIKPGSNILVLIRRGEANLFSALDIPDNKN